MNAEKNGANAISVDIFIYFSDIYVYMKSKATQFMHSPTLNTVLMVEKTLSGAKELLKVSELKRRLPRQVMHGTLVQILDYLQQSGKILFTPKGVVWIYRSSHELEIMKKGGLEL